MPLGLIMPSVFLILTTLFVITTVDSMSYSISMAVTGDENPPKPIRLFWAIIMAAIATILIKIGGGGIDALQSFVVIAAVPVSILSLPVVWDAPKLARVLAIEQGIVKKSDVQDRLEKKKVNKIIVISSQANQSSKSRNLLLHCTDLLW